MSARRRVRLVGAVLMLMLVTTACNEDDGSGEPATSPDAGARPTPEKTSPPPAQTTATPGGERFCPLLKRAIGAQLQLVQNFEGDDLQTTLQAIQAINRQLATAAPAELRSTVATFVAGGEALVSNVQAGRPDPGAAMRTPDVQAASRRLYDYGTKTCKISVSGG